MLILTRRVGESLMIGDDVTITVLGVKGNQQDLGLPLSTSLGALVAFSVIFLSITWFVVWRRDRL